MFRSSRRAIIVSVFVSAFVVATVAASTPASWKGALRMDEGRPVQAATVTLQSSAGQLRYSATTSPDGSFAFAGLASGTYDVVVLADGVTTRADPLSSSLRAQRLLRI